MMPESFTTLELPAPGLDLPPITQQELLHVDGTPDEEYPIRILLAYRENCNCKWKADPPHPLWDRMNSDQDERATLLDAAIAALRRSNADSSDGAHKDSR